MGEWKTFSEAQPELDTPLLVGWIAAPWLTAKTPNTYLQAVCRTDAGDGLWTWAHWEGGPWPIGDDCEWDEDMVPTHWQPWPAPPTST